MATTRPQVSARQRIDARYRSPGKASDFISPLQIKRGRRYVIVCRKSPERGKRKEKSLARQQADLTREIEARGGIVVDVVKRPWAGSDPVWLKRAAKIAKSHRATIVAESTNRLIRHPDYAGKLDATAHPRQLDLAELRWSTDGVPLMTLLHPDASAKRERSIESASGRKQGTPKKAAGKKTPGSTKAKRLRLQPKAIAMDDEGFSLREISRALDDEPVSNIRRWLLF